MKRILLKILVAILVTVVYFVSAIMETGGGHGNFYVFAPLFPPWIWLSLIVAFLLSDYLDNKILKVIFVCLMLIHYVGLFYGLYDYSFENDAGWKQGHLAIGTPVLYLVMQIAFWYFIFRKSKEDLQLDL